MTATVTSLWARVRAFARGGLIVAVLGLWAGPALAGGATSGAPASTPVDAALAASAAAALPTAAPAVSASPAPAALQSAPMTGIEVVDGVLYNSVWYSTKPVTSFHGLVPEGATDLRFIVNGTTYAQPVPQGRVWGPISFALPHGGPHSVWIRYKSASGVDLGSGLNNLYVDLDFPTVTFVPPPASPAQEEVTFTVQFSRQVNWTTIPNSQFFVTGTGGAAGTVAGVTLNADRTQASVRVRPTGEGTIQLNLRSGVRTGPHTVQAATSANYAVDRKAPSTPVLVEPVEGQILGLNSRVQATGDPGSRLRVYLNGVHRWNSNFSESGTWGISAQVFPEGENTIYLEGYDDAGNVSAASPTVRFTVDLTPPSTPVVVSPAANGTV